MVMKKIKDIILILLILISFSIQAQQYYPFPSDSATWTTIEYGYGTFPPETGTSHFGLVGDTIINGLTYSKLYANLGSLGAINPASSFNILTANFHGAIREDSSKKIWFNQGGANPVDLLYYDFSLNLGDTFCFDPPQPSGASCLPVSSVDSILINGNYRRQIHFNYGGQTETWIEGIGSIVDNFYGAWSFIGNIEFSLNCFYQANTHLYGPCNYPTSLNESVNKSVELILFPNPTESQLTLNTDLEIGKILLLDITGKQMILIKKNTNTINVNNLPNGIYFLKLITNERTITKKFIKQ
jgi:hypothetical protein